ncbi:hypothetical protein CsSME_00037789 [Camellia sinensis var. sinensis]
MDHVSDTAIQDTTAPASKRGNTASQIFSSLRNGVGGSQSQGLNGSVKGMDDQGVLSDISRAMITGSTISPVFYNANIPVGQVNDAQVRDSINHMPRKSCVFSGVRDSEVETEHWLMELSKYASCPIEENEMLNGREGVSGKELSVSRGGVRRGGALVRKGARELRNLVRTINYDRRHEEVRGDNVSQ